MKECKAEGCNNKVFSHLYCKVHQYLREDDKWLTSKARAKGNYNKQRDVAYDYKFDSSVLNNDNKKVYKDTKKKRKSPVSSNRLPERGYKVLYTTFFDIVKDDYPLCENKGCNRRMVDVHHLDNKGIGGSKEKDYIENLMGLCRECHNKAHNDTTFNEGLRKQHLTNIINKLKGL
jgi:5-methylcytosine-specific restriction endonuclease McrA